MTPEILEVLKPWRPPQYEAQIVASQMYGFRASTGTLLKASLERPPPLAPIVVILNKNGQGRCQGKSQIRRQILSIEYSSRAQGPRDLKYHVQSNQLDLPMLPTAVIQLPQLPHSNTDTADECICDNIDVFTKPRRDPGRAEQSFPRLSTGASVHKPPVME